MLVKTPPTAREQFVEDYLLVAENDFQMWTALQDYADQAEQVAVGGKAVWVLAERLENEWNDAVISETEEMNEVMSLMVRQMLIGYGRDAFYDIAKHVFLARS